jgi:hypothetical protein
MNFSWPQRAAGKSARRSAVRVGLIGIASLTVVGAAALAAPAMSAMAATGNATTTVVTNPLFPITEPVDTPAPVNVTVTDDVAGGPAPTGTVLVTSADVPGQNPAAAATSCTADLAPAAGLNGDGLAYSTGTCDAGGIGWGFVLVQAEYSGDDNNAASSTLGTEVKIVNLYPDTTAVTAPAGIVGNPVTLVGTLGGPAGGNVLSAYPEIETAVPPNPDTITFTVTNADGATVATCDTVPLAGGTTAAANYADCTVPGTLAAGTYKVTADFAGDEYAAPSTGTGTLTIAAAAQATTTTMSGVSGYVGSNVTLAAKVAGASTPTGTVKFVQGSTTLCSATLSNGTAKCAHAWSGAGSYSVEAVYEGNAANKASSAVATVKVNKRATSVKVTASKATKGKAVTLTATVTSSTSATGTVTFSVNGHTYSVKLVNGKATVKYTWKTAGTYKVTATYGGNSTHLSSKGTVSVKVAS